MNLSQMRKTFTSSATKKITLRLKYRDKCTVLIAKMLVAAQVVDQKDYDATKATLDDIQFAWEAFKLRRRKIGWKTYCRFVVNYLDSSFGEALPKLGLSFLRSRSLLAWYSAGPRKSFYGNTDRVYYFVQLSVYKSLYFFVNGVLPDVDSMETEWMKSYEYRERELVLEDLGCM